MNILVKTVQIFALRLQSYSAVKFVRFFWNILYLLTQNLTACPAAANPLGAFFVLQFFILRRSALD